MDIPDIISTENYDGRYSVPCYGLDPPFVVFDCNEGVGSSPNNSDIRYFGAVVMMFPDIFLKLASFLPEQMQRQETRNFLSTVSFDPGFGPPSLSLTRSWVFNPEFVPEVLSHEGRHRTKYIMNHCPNIEIPVQIFIPEVRARHLNGDGEILSTLREAAQGEDGNYVPGPLFDVAIVDGQLIEWIA